MGIYVDAEYEGETIRTKSFANIKRAWRFLDGCMIDNLQTLVTVKSAEEIDDTIKFLEVAKKCFRPTATISDIDFLLKNNGRLSGLLKI